MPELEVVTEPPRSYSFHEYILWLEGRFPEEIRREGSRVLGWLCLTWGHEWGSRKHEGQRKLSLYTVEELNRAGCEYVAEMVFEYRMWLEKPTAHPHMDGIINNIRKTDGPRIPDATESGIAEWFQKVLIASLTDSAD
jgi:hypothetical protein